MADLLVAHVVHGTQAEGPGVRTAIWVQGCSIRCPGCCNPELFTTRGGEGMSPPDLVAQAVGIQGITVVGGEPFEQPEALAELARVRGALSMVVFSGYPLEDLRARACPHTHAVLDSIDVLVDGPYDQARPDPHRRFVGSTNQRIHFLTDRYGPRDFEGPRTVELRYQRGSVTVVGWPT